MEVKSSLCNQIVAAEQKQTQRTGGCSFAGYQNPAEGNAFPCKNTKERVKRTTKDFKNRVQEQCFTLNRSEGGPCCLKTHKAMPALFFCCMLLLYCFRHTHRLPSVEWDRWCVGLLGTGLPLNTCLSLSTVLLQSNWRVATNFKCFCAYTQKT